MPKTGFNIRAVSSMGGYSSVSRRKGILVFLRKNKGILILILIFTKKFPQNSPFYCNFGPKMVEKMGKYKELRNNALSLKWGKIRIFWKNIHPFE